MTDLVTAAQMSAIEQTAMQSGATTGLHLMELAGAGVVAEILAMWPDLAAGAPQAVVCCGPGNNGGDGYVIARLLHERGWQVNVFALAPPSTADAQANCTLWQKLGPMAPMSALDWHHTRAAAVVVDAMFGTGLQRNVAPGVWGVLAMAQESGAHLVAVDILSGLCADSGRIRAEGGFVDFAADLTVTFEAAKTGHMLAMGPELSGVLRVVPLGLAALRDDADLAQLVEPAAEKLRKLGGHKFDHGHAYVFAGGAGRGGAGRLAARAALRIGAGLVTLACPPDAMVENAARLDAVMLRPIADAAGVTDSLADARITGLCIGPGLGLTADREAMVAAVLAGKRATVLDADALTLIARNPALFGALHDGCVLTPHAGEFARLFPDLAQKLGAEPTGRAYSKLDATAEAARRAGCVVLFKGADTVIADPRGFAAISAASYDRAAPWLATAGAGDVLAGMILGLLARGLRPFDAACNAAWLHVECARNFGPGLIAEDLPDQLPKVLRALMA